MSPEAIAIITEELIISYADFAHNKNESKISHILKMEKKLLEELR